MKTKMPNTPLFQEIRYTEPSHVFAAVAEKPWSIFFDSANHAQTPHHTNRYSYIAYAPFQTLLLKDGIIAGMPTHESVDPFLRLKQWLQKFSMQKIPGLPPFQGGLAGYFAYDLCHYLENIPYAAHEDCQFPDLAVALYDSVISFDHQAKKAWLVATGFSEPDKEKQEQHARHCLAEMLRVVEHSARTSPHQPGSIKKDSALDIHSNFSKENYLKLVEDAREYILAGDIFQVNVAQRFMAQLPAKQTPWSLYRVMRDMNPAPFAAFINLDRTVIASASPERFIALQQGHIETRPIKGTARRGNTAEEDTRFADQLLCSSKERSENVMIVDLMRNDLARVSMDDSVYVEKLCGLESYATVHHLVSVIKSKLRPDMDATDVLRATLPGGSVTGVPKVRAMQIIAELEPHRRGPYCGCIGFIGFNGDMDTSIVIRTYAIHDNIVTYHAGGAIVLHSDAELEYQESLQKARALTEALRQL